MMRVRWSSIRSIADEPAFRSIGVYAGDALNGVDGVDGVDEQRARAIGSLHQALVSGVLVQWLIDPERAPSPAELAQGMRAIAELITPG